MAAPEHLECSRELAEQWPRLAGDVEVMVTLLRAKEGLYRCCLSDVRVRQVEKALTRSFIASGARCSCYGIAVADAVALYAFRGRTGVRQWNGALSGLTELTVEATRHNPAGPGEPELSFGSVTGGPTPMRFVTGPAYSVAERALCPYLELRLNLARLA